MAERSTVALPRPHPSDPYDRRLALTAPGLLQAFNVSGVLDAADVHVARRLGRLARESDEAVLLAAAIAVRAVRAGSVCVDLSVVSELAPELPWPAADAWVRAVATSSLVEQGVLDLEGRDLYLHRYWQEEGQVVEDLLTRDAATAPQLDEDALDGSLAAYFDDGSPEQRDAAELACRRWTSVITGGPGTGKTTTIARLLGVLLSVEGELVRVALAAPTGKAAARMTEALRQATEAPGFPGRDPGSGAGDGERRNLIRGLEASTVHRLLGWRFDSSTRFSHDRANPLPYDVVVVDETSMVSLTLMARLLEAMRPQARLVMVGDAHQLASVEAGAVLGDLVRGWSGHGPVRVLSRVHRFGKNIAELAEAINRGDGDGVVAILGEGREPAAPGDGTISRVEPGSLDGLLAGQARELWEAGRAGQAERAWHTFERHRLLCAHRDGPHGVGWWNRHVERLLMDGLGQDWLEEWYPGRPFIVNANDRGLRLWNGDTGVAMLPAGEAAPGEPRMVGVLGTGGAATRLLPTTRLSDVSTAHAMTVHRSQGSQFDEVTVVLPEPDSRILTRELFYTAVTRARSVVRVVGSEAAVRAAVERRARRATGLARRLGPSAGPVGWARRLGPPEPA